MAPRLASSERAATSVQVYTDFISEFVDNFEDMMGDVVTEITVGMGPAGELRYPAYPEGDRRWRFPGVGEFQCYDRYMLSSLRAAADDIGEPDWYVSFLLLPGEWSVCSGPA
jgi:beta-amylase